MRITLEKVRLSFPSLYKKANFNEAETKYEATFLLDKTQHAKLIKEMQTVIADKMKNDLKGAKLAADKICLKDGAESGVEGYENLYVIKASNAARPLTVDRDRSVLAEEDNKFYAGCYVNAIIELWAMNNKFGKRICAKLNGVQFHSDGEPFAGRKNVTPNDFKLIEDSQEQIDFA